MARNEKKTAPPAEIQLPPFEQSLEQLEKVVQEIECGEVTLEQSIERYEHGMKLIKHCRAILDRAETKIRMLTVDENGRVFEGQD